MGEKRGRTSAKKVVLIILLLCVCLTSPVNATVIHNISFTNNILIVKSTLLLESEKKLDYWSLKIEMPKDVRIIDLRDEIGKINYKFLNNTLEFKTNKKNSYVRKINLLFSKNIEEKYGLKIIHLNLFGFKNETTIIISKKTPYFFVPDAEIEFGNTIKARKLGGAYVTMIFGGKKESKHYFTNSDLNLDLFEKYYWIPEGITGLKIPVKFAIVPLPENKYDVEIENWSGGAYTDGIIFVKENKDLKEIVATVLHETTHGFNSFALDFDKTNVSWFDEGVACYVGSVVYRLLNKTRPQIFGEPIKWVNGTYTYTLNPILTPEDLYKYYNNKENWVLYWYPSKYKDDYRRLFGYAYSELFIREYLSKEGGRLHSVYDKLLKINKSVYDPVERNQIILSALEEEFKPCYSKKLKEIKECTKKLNLLDFNVPKIGGKEINQIIEVPKPPEPKEEDLFLVFLNEIEKLFNNIFNYLLSLFQQ